MPFITERLWQQLNEVCPNRTVTGVEIPTGDLLVTAAWPRANDTIIDTDAEEAFATVQEVVSALRQIRTQHKVPPRQQLVFSAAASGDLADAINTHAELIATMANVTCQPASPDTPAPDDAAVAVLGDARLYLHGLVDSDAERTRLTKQIEELDNSVSTLEGRLANKNYAEKAPPHLVQQTRDQLADAQREIESLRQQLTAME